MFHRIQKCLKRCLAFLNHYRGEILYYAAVMAVLSAIAWGAEQYRIRRDEEQVQPAGAAAVQIVQPEAEDARFELPEGMVVLRNYSETPLWNADDQSWQAHPAVDYACADGVVRALADGTVQTVGKSGVLGGFIEIRSGEVALKYCCIRPEDELEPGDEIRKGDPVAMVENAMPGEKQLGEHLHLEAYRSGEIINPGDLLEEND